MNNIFAVYICILQNSIIPFSGDSSNESFTMLPEIGQIYSISSIFKEDFCDCLTLFWVALAYFTDELTDIADICSE